MIKLELKRSQVMKILITLLLMFVPTDVYGSDMKSDANKKPYTFVKESQLNKEARKFIGLHERDTNQYIGSYLHNKYDMDCLKLLEVAIQQSYEGCLMTAKLEPIIDPEKDRNEQIRKHNKQKKALKTHICKNQMLAAKYHHQETICRQYHGYRWKTIAKELADRKIYKYTNLYIKKTALTWRFSGRYKLDKEYYDHPIHLAGNIKNYAYDKK